MTTTNELIASQINHIIALADGIPDKALEYLHEAREAILIDHYVETCAYLDVVIAVLPKKCMGNWFMIQNMTALVKFSVVEVA